MSRATTTGSASALPSTLADARTVALSTLADAAGYWSEAEDLAWSHGPNPGGGEALTASRDRILSEAAAIPAETREGLRHKARIITRLQGAALRDDESMTDAGRALLRSVISDLQRDPVDA